MLTTLLTQQTSGVTANLSATLADVALSSDATISVAGITADLSATLGAVTLSSDATVASAGISGDLSATLGALTLSGTGTITQPGITASLSVTLGAVTLASLATGPQLGGGGASAKRRGRLRGEGWGRERGILEASLQRIEQQDVQRIARVMADSERPQAQRIARKLIDYSGEAAEIESLRREIAKLEAARRERIAAEASQAEREADLRAAMAELRDVLRDDEEVMYAIDALEQLEARQILGALGLTIH